MIEDMKILPAFFTDEEIQTLKEYLEIIKHSEKIFNVNIMNDKTKEDIEKFKNIYDKIYDLDIYLRQKRD